MRNLTSLIFGPLAAPECRMALARGWLIFVRTLAAMAVVGTSLVVIWWWWIGQLSDPLHVPFEELRVGLVIVLGMMVAIALILGPAVLAGSLAGDKERGALALLLTTRVDSREIVMGRLTGKLTQVAMILLACYPALIWLGALAGLRLEVLLTATLLPIAVAIGGGGLAVVASTLSRRARDSLLAVYFVDMLFMLTPLSRAFNFSQGLLDGLAAFNPFVCLDSLLYREHVELALLSIAVWLVLGVTGVAIASWRLRPAALAPMDGDRVRLKGFRQLWVPAVNEERPMIWKELFIERVGSLGFFGRWVGILLVVALVGGTLGLGATALWNESKGDTNGWGIWSRDQLQFWIGGMASLLSILIQMGIGLRAAVTISSERERGTWDSLLTSPLEGGEIIIGKVWGSLYALRYLVAAAFFAWTFSAFLEVISPWQTFDLALRTLVGGAFMAAVGVRTSLACNTATRSMSVTIGIWIGALVMFSILAFIVVMSSILLCNTGLVIASQLGAIPPPKALWLPVRWEIAWPIALQTIYLGATISIVADTRLRFDRLAGRITEGSVAIAVDQFFHGRPASLEAAEAELAEIRGE